MEKKEKRYFNKKVIFLIIIFLLLIVGGVFLLLGREKEEVFVEEIKFEPPENYVIKDTPEGKIVENKNAGLSFKVPEGWGVETYEEEVDLISPDVELNEYERISPNSIREKGGCGISIEIAEYQKIYPDTETDADRIQTYIIKTKENPEEMKEEGYEVIEIDRQVALKEVIAAGTYASVQVPVDKKVYFFNSFLFSTKCTQEFDKFLETISISK